MLTQERVIELLRQQFPYLVSEFSVRRIGLFGSFATGSAGDRSDIDLLVEFERPIGLRFVELGEYLERLFGRKVDLLTPVGVQGIRRKPVAQRIAESLIYV